MMPKPKANSEAAVSSGRYAYQGLERSMHEKARLGIMTSLLLHPDGVSFNELKQLCDLTDGNLSRHLEVLQEDGLVQQEKLMSSGRPTTVCRLSAEGRKRFLVYLEELQRVLADATAASTATPLALPKWNWTSG